MTLVLIISISVRIVYRNSIALIQVSILCKELFNAKRDNIAYLELQLTLCSLVIAGLDIILISDQAVQKIFIFVIQVIIVLQERQRLNISKTTVLLISTVREAQQLKSVWKQVNSLNQRFTKFKKMKLLLLLNSFLGAQNLFQLLSTKRNLIRITKKCPRP